MQQVVAFSYITRSFSCAVPLPVSVCALAKRIPCPRHPVPAHHQAKCERWKREDETMGSFKLFCALVSLCVYVRTCLLSSLLTCLHCAFLLASLADARLAQHLALN